MNVPSKDTLAMFEARLGRPVTTVLIWLIAAGVAITSLGLIVATVRATFAALRPFVASTGWTDWFFRLAVIAIYGAGFWIVMRKLRRLETHSALQERLNEIEKHESEMNESVRKQVERIDDRLKYVEGKVGDELLDVLVERQLNQQGLTVGELQRVVRQLPAPDPLTQAEQQRIEHARKLLREAAAAARGAEEAGGDFDKATNQAWLHTQLVRLVSDMFTFAVYKPFGDFLEGREWKLKQHGERRDGKSHLVAIGEYLEELARRLKVEDIDPKAKFPSSFAEFAKGE